MAMEYELQSAVCPLHKPPYASNDACPTLVVSIYYEEGTNPLPGHGLHPKRKTETNDGQIIGRIERFVRLTSVNILSMNSVSSIFDFPLHLTSPASCATKLRFMILPPVFDSLSNLQFHFYSFLEQILHNYPLPNIVDLNSLF